MITNRVLQAIKEKIASKYILLNEPMKHHSYFKIGGPADLLITPSSIEDIKYAYDTLNTFNIPITLLGNGSNILVSDKGIRGAVIKIAEPFNQIMVEDKRMIVNAGALLSTTSNLATTHGLAGFEFASGIPGTIGGAVFMNAGAYGGEMIQVTDAVTVLTPSGDILRLTRDQLSFGYRRSNIQDLNYVALQVELLLESDKTQAIQARIDELTSKRTSKQPLHLPSAGSTFKRPEGFFAGKLIEDSGLRGVRFGDAAVSEKHCGFVVNMGDATCQQVTTLIQFIQKTVFDNYGVCLQPEVRMVGEGF